MAAVRTLLDVQIASPEIEVLVALAARERIELRVGTLTVKNSFSSLPASGADAVLDTLHLTLDGLGLAITPPTSRLPAGKGAQRVPLTDAITITTSVVRLLDAAPGRATVPATKVEANVSAICLRVVDAHLLFLLTYLNTLKPLPSSASSSSAPAAVPPAAPIAEATPAADVTRSEPAVAADGDPSAPPALLVNASIVKLAVRLARATGTFLPTHPESLPRSEQPD